MTYTPTDENEDERIYAWHKVAEHPFFKECYDTQGPLLNAMIRKLDRVHERLTR